MKLLTVLILMIGISFSTTSLARGKFKIGDQDTLHVIQAVDLKGSNGEDLNLSYRTSITFFIAGLYLTDHSYVLSKKNSLSGSFYDLTAENISLYQSKGLLPNPLPTYQVEVSEYLIGYSLWLIFIAICLYYVLKQNVKKIVKLR